MQINHLSLLADPITFEKLCISGLRTNGREVIDGLLLAKSSWYPIIDGIPRILVGSLRQDFLKNHIAFFKEYKSKLPPKVKIEWKGYLKNEVLDTQETRHQISTGASFAYEWEHIYKENTYEKNNYLHFISPYLKENDLRGKQVIDLGCGSGRFTKQAALMGAKIVVGVDVGESVDTAYKICRGLKNVLIIQADIYQLPFTGIFNIAHSIGVLHHLPQPKKGFLSCLKVLKAKGKMIIWVYNRRNNIRALYFYEPLRSISRHIPRNILYKFCYIPATCVHLINIFTKNMNNPPFGYYRNFPFNMKLNDAFDVLSTPKSNYYYKEEIINWFKQGKLSKIKAFEHPEAGITCIGSK